MRRYFHLSAMCLAPHAQANVSIPVLVLESHIAQQSGTLAQGICQLTIYKQPGLHASNRPSPKLTPQPEPTSATHGLSLPAVQ